MTYITDELEDSALPLPITQVARRTAQQFASQQPTPQKAEQVRLNTLAVCVVNDYLQMMGIPTHLTASDSWNPVVRLCADVADLTVAGVGRLECRPFRASGQTCYIPPEAWLDRIGYVVVEIDEAFLEATVLGFVQTAATEEFPISQLEPVEALISHLTQQMQPMATAIATASQRMRVNLSQWLANIFETGWQTVDTVLNPSDFELAFRFRSANSELETDSEQPDVGLRRAKLIDLGMQLAGYSIALIVELKPESEQRTNILLQVYPTGNRLYLPPLLQLIVLDESGAIFLEAQARTTDNYIQLQFSGTPGELFSVKLALGDISFIEDFMI